MRFSATTASITLMTTTESAQNPALTATAATPLPASNPFSQLSTLPFQAPPFDRITNADYAPALLAGMAAQWAEISVITRARSAPTSENTIAALERVGRLLERARPRGAMPGEVICRRARHAQQLRRRRL